LKHYTTSLKVVSLRPDEENECFSVCIVLPVALGPGVYLVSDRNEYQKQKNSIPGE
jgi:hypothetical protein